jgi:hypothetical protein
VEQTKAEIAMDKSWIDEKFRMLSARFGVFRPNPNDFYFEPTDTIYTRLESGDERDLQFVVNAISEHIDLSPTPFAVYEWGLKMNPEVAGQVRPKIHYIQIPFFYVGKKYATGAIIAHEITHAFLFSRRIWIADTQENEFLTDIATVFVGLGKLLLNGLITTANETVNESYKLSYLSEDMIFYCFDKVREYRAIDLILAQKNLVPNIKKKVGDLQKTDER